MASVIHFCRVLSQQHPLPQPPQRQPQRASGVIACAVYDDRFVPIFTALGRWSVQRATQVEFDPASREWVATLLSSGAIIARGPQRVAVIAAEVAWLEANGFGHDGGVEHTEGEENNC